MRKHLFQSQTILSNRNSSGPTKGHRILQKGLCISAGQRLISVSMNVSSVHPFHQHRSRNFKRLGDSNDVLDTWVADSTLDSADIGLVEIGSFSERQLCKSFRFPVPAHAGTE